MQIGCSRPNWAIALLKELIDNSLDACESKGVSPIIDICIEHDSVSILDNGPGLTDELIEGSLDYLINASDKAYYVSPTRGQLGNALKCVWAAPFVVDGNQGDVEIHTNGQAHKINVRLDRIAQEPRISHAVTASNVKNGTLVKFGWSGIARYLTGDVSSVSYIGVKALLARYTAFNPHATFKLSLDGKIRVYEAAYTGFSKWLPTEQTSPHWYDVDRFSSLICFYLKNENERNDGNHRTVRELVKQFRYLTGSAKQKAVTDAAGLTNSTLRDLVEGGELSRDKAERLLSAMQEESRPVQPAQLGAIGEQHLTQFLVQSCAADLDTVGYRKVSGCVDGLPFIIEMAFGAQSAGDGIRDEAIEVFGLNWTPVLRPPLPALSEILGEVRIDSFDPVSLVIHLICPRFDWTDRGKGTVQLPLEMEEALERCVRTATKKWTALKRQTDKNNRVSQRMMDHYRQQAKARQLTAKDASYMVMKESYLVASGGGTLPAKARQIMYQARPRVIALTGKTQPWSNTDTFTQGYLVDYIEEHPDLTASWDVVFDARGHITEPHTGESVDLGTLEVRGYIRDWHAGKRTDVTTDIERIFTTCGPENRFRYALFIEKEGFNQLWKAVKLSERYDLAIMSTKGMSVTAARRLVDELSQKGVTILVLRDFDKYGFSIAHTLCNDSRRYKFKNRPKVIDLGLRLADVKSLGLDAEPVDYKGEVDPGINLAERGATQDEIDFLVTGQAFSGWHGQRVEINAIPSDVLVAWLEAKLKDIGVSKIVPDDDVLAQAWREALLHKKALDAFNKIMEEGTDDEPLPDGLRDEILEAIDGKAESWDQALWHRATGNQERKN
jgi:DNA topoisomerase VI subunit B